MTKSTRNLIIFFLVIGVPAVVYVAFTGNPISAIIFGAVVAAIIALAIFFDKKPPNLR